MKFLLDAQLPRRLALELATDGHDEVHTLDLPTANRTQDADISTLATQEGRVVVTKDNDFVVSFHLRGAPPKLLLVSTGNISNEKLSQLFAANLAALEKAFSQHVFVELSATAIMIHA
jgi:predicted nuclease of predicted toxin-antitoxin system